MVWLLDDCVGIFLLVCLTKAVRVVSECEVQVSEPWPRPYLFVPQNSKTFMNCISRSTSSEDSPFWAIDLPDEDAAQYRSSDREFNANGFYELPVIEAPGMPTVLRLLINDTSRNNQTEIICSRRNLDTTLITFDPSPLEVEFSEVGLLDSINVSWSSSGQLSAAASAELSYSLTISYGSTRDLLLINESHYIFKAPQGSPPCQVYNFSVSATPLGATYTGDGCSVPGFNQTMLPSLPDITALELSLNHSLIKRGNNVSLTVMFDPADYCEQYPVLNYVLEVENTFEKLLLSLTMADNLSITIDSLSEDIYYSFKVVVSNSIGNISTNRTGFYTTDVQGVTAEAIETGNSFVVWCDFISGSEAHGCLVVILGVRDNITVEVERGSSLVLNISAPLSCYCDVLAFDIERDGSVGTQAVPGRVVGKLDSVKCSTRPGTNSNLPYSVIIGCTAALAVVVLVVVVILLIIILFCIKRSRTRRSRSQCREAAHCSNTDSLTGIIKCVDDPLVVYDKPLVAISSSSSGHDSAPDYSKTDHFKKEEECITMDTTSATDGTATYSELNNEQVENYYHTLEEARPLRGIEVSPPEPGALGEDPPPYTPTSPSPQQPPVYQEITGLPKSTSASSSLGLKCFKSGDDVTTAADCQCSPYSVSRLAGSNGVCARSESLV